MDTSTRKTSVNGGYSITIFDYREDFKIDEVWVQPPRIMGMKTTHLMLGDRWDEHVDYTLTGRSHMEDHLQITMLVYGEFQGLYIIKNPSRNETGR